MPRKRSHVTAVDNADAELILDTIESPHRARFDPELRLVMHATLATFLADKREAWLAVAMVRVERLFKVTRRPPPKPAGGVVARRKE